MISTLRANNGTVANLGSVAMQPVAGVVAAAVQQTTTLPHPSAPAVVPGMQVALTNPILVRTGTDLTVAARSTISDLANLMATNLATVAPLPSSPFGGQGNVIVPTYSLQLDAGKTTDPRTLLGFLQTTRRFTPYEQLTGITQDRPEILMLTNFQPLFDKDVSHSAPDYVGHIDNSGTDRFMTDAGEFIDTQAQMRNLRAANASQLVASLRQRYSAVDRLVVAGQDSVSAGIKALNVTGSFFLNLVRIVEAAKQQLDLRHDVYVVDPSSVAQSLQSNFSKAQVQVQDVSGLATPSLVASVAQTQPPSYDFVTTLVELGYDPDNVSNVYSSTKLWMQALVEMSHALKQHTLQFIDIDPTYQRADANASVILDPPVSRFDVAATLPTVPSLTTLANMQPPELAQASSDLEAAFSSLYTTVTFKDEEARIAALAHLLSNEYRYSVGLTQGNVQRILHDYYGFTVQGPTPPPGGNPHASVAPTANASVFDYVIGRFGNNITDFPTQNSNTLAALAQLQPGTSDPRIGSRPLAVLSFETKYVVGDVGTVTPGGDYFFDRIMQTDGTAFNVSALQSFGSLLTQARQQFSTVIDGMNLLELPRGDGTLTSTGDFLGSISAQLLDSSGNTLPAVLNDNASALFTLARTDDQVKSLLFVYVIAKITRSYNTNSTGVSAGVSADNTPLVNDIIDALLGHVQDTFSHGQQVNQLLQSSRLSASVISDALTESSITNSLRGGTPLILMVERFMTQVLAQFRGTSLAIFNERTVYGGLLDSVVMMVAFDFVVSMIARYGNQSIVGYRPGTSAFAQNMRVYVVSRSSDNMRASINELNQRASGQAALVQQVVMTVVNGMQKLAATMTAVANYLQSPAATQQLRSFARFINDPQLLPLMLTEQQIMLMASTIGSIDGALGLPPAPASKGLSRPRPSPTDTSVIVLDGSTVQSQLLDALYAFFGSGDLASAAAGIKKVLTIGIPSGFVQQLKQQVSIQQQTKASFQDRRSDIMQVNVYKVDLQNGDIVYRPQTFLFEMSRFPVRFSTTGWLPLPANAGMQDVINAIPTQSYLQDPANGTASSVSSGLEYASSAVAGNDGVRAARVAFDDDSYSFLSAQQRSSILTSHVASQLLEAYVKLMTGLSVSENDFDMVDPPSPTALATVQTLLQHATANISDSITARGAQLPSSSPPPAGGILFTTTGGRNGAPVVGGHAARATSRPQLSNPSGVAGNVSASSQARAISTAAPATQTLQQQAPVGTVDANLGNVGPDDVPLVLSSLRALNTLSNTLSTLSDPAAINRRVMSPKQFDRVFSILIDPNNFQIDVPATIATPYGRSALTLMLKNGDVVQASGGQTVAPSSLLIAARELSAYGSSIYSSTINGFKWRTKSKYGGDLLSEQYFVTVSAFSADGTPQ